MRMNKPASRISVYECNQCTGQYCTGIHCHEINPKPEAGNNLCKPVVKKNKTRPVEIQTVNVDNESRSSQEQPRQTRVNWITIRQESHLKSRDSKSSRKRVSLAFHLRPEPMTLSKERSSLYDYKQIDLDQFTKIEDLEPL
jgi:hypothetical protein